MTNHTSTEFDEWVFRAVQAHFHGEPCHSLTAPGKWDLPALMERYSNCTTVTASLAETKGKARKTDYELGALIAFPTKGTAMVVPGNGSVMHIYSRTAEEGRALHQEVMRHWKPRKRERNPPACFNIISVGRGGPDVESIPLREQRKLPGEDLGLLYGDDMPAWHESLTKTLRDGQTGLVLLQGSAGTGKTSFIRHLIVQMKEKISFYYLSLADVPVLSRVDFVPFWNAQTRMERREGLKKVIIVEDADSLLRKRDDANRELLSSLLNATDGLLAEFLQLTLILTINMPVQDIDPAVLRNGRLLHFRSFPRIGPDQARRIADAKGIGPLPDRSDWSLAEIFRSNGGVETVEPVVGFRVQAA